MNLIDHIYFNVYRWYNNMKLSGRKVDPINMTSTIFGMWFSGWTLDGIWLYYHFTQKEMNKEEWVIAVIIGFMGSFLINSIYSSTKERYIKVCNHYNSVSRSTKLATFLSFLFLVFPYIVFVICIIIYKGY